MTNKRKLILILFLLIIIGILGYLYIKYNNEKKAKEELAKQETKENLERFADYLSSARIVAFDQFDYNFNIDNITDDMILDYLYGAYKNYFINENEISKDEIYNYLNYVFGPKVDFTINNFGYSNNINDYCIKYNNKKNIYKYNDKCLDEPRFVSVNCIIDTYIENDIYFVLVKHYYLLNGLVYNNYNDMLNRKNEIYSYESEDLVNTQVLICQNVNNYPSSIRKYSFITDGNEFAFNSYEFIK